MTKPKTPPSREEAYRRIQEGAARTVAGWPEWKRNATQVPVEERGLHNRVRSAAPTPPSSESREEAYRRIQEGAARTVASWPAHKRGNTEAPAGNEPADRGVGLHQPHNVH